MVQRIKNRRRSLAECVNERREMAYDDLAMVDRVFNRIMPDGGTDQRPLSKMSSLFKHFNTFIRGKSGRLYIWYGDDMLVFTDNKSSLHDFIDAECEKDFGTATLLALLTVISDTNEYWTALDDNVCS